MGGIAYEDDSVADVAKLMSDHQIRRLPIVNADKRLVGIVALGDFAVDSEDITVAGEALAEISTFMKKLTTADTGAAWPH